MTCIVAVTHHGRVYMGGDSAGVKGLQSNAVAQPKVFRNDGFVMGYTSSFRMGQLLQYSFTPPPMTDNLMRYMVTDFVNALRNCMKDAGYAKVKENEESAGTFLVAYEDRLFCIEDYFSIIEVANSYAACGCGEQFAAGSFHSTQGRAPRIRIEMALQAAAHHSAGVRGPFHLEMT